MIQIGNKHHGSKGYYIGRGSIFGNPFIMKNESDRDKVIEQYKEWLEDRLLEDSLQRNEFMKLAERVKNGEDITLVCFCAPKKCHGDYLKELLEDFTKE
jgi:hypothetical protein